MCCRIGVEGKAPNPNHQSTTQWDHSVKIQFLKHFETIFVLQVLLSALKTNILSKYGEPNREPVENYHLHPQKITWTLTIHRNLCFQRAHVSSRGVEYVPREKHTKSRARRTNWKQSCRCVPPKTCRNCLSLRPIISLLSQVTIEKNQAFRFLWSCLLTTSLTTKETNNNFKKKQIQ